MFKNIQTVLDGWIGTKYIHNGKNKNGVDCANFIAAVLLEAGMITKIDYANHYASDWFWHSEKEAIVDNLNLHKKYINGTFEELYDIENIAPMPGDLLLFKHKVFNKVNHMGIYYGDNMLVHAVETLGVRKDQFKPFWNRRLYMIFRIKEH